MRLACCVLSLGLAWCGGAWARAPEHESYFSRQASLQQQQPLPAAPNPAFAAGPLLVITPQPFTPPPPPFRVQFGR